RKGASMRTYFRVSGALRRGAVCGVLGVLLVPAGVFPANPASGSLGPTAGAKVTWVGTQAGGTSLSAEASCTPDTCDTFLLTLTGRPADWAKKVAQVELNWSLIAATDYDFYVHKGSPDGPIVARSTEAATNHEADDID